jgi:hypothetical protein
VECLINPVKIFFLGGGGWGVNLKGERGVPLF